MLGLGWAPRPLGTTRPPAWGVLSSRFALRPRCAGGLEGGRRTLLLPDTDFARPPSVCPSLCPRSERCTCPGGEETSSGLRTRVPRLLSASACSCWATLLSPAPHPRPCLLGEYEPSDAVGLACSGTRVAALTEAACRLLEPTPEGRLRVFVLLLRRWAGACSGSGDSEGGEPSGERDRHAVRTMGACWPALCAFDRLHWTQCTG